MVIDDNYVKNDLIKMVIDMAKKTTIKIHHIWIFNLKLYLYINLTYFRLF
jgi:hypothetical protein